LSHWSDSIREMSVVVVMKLFPTLNCLNFGDFKLGSCQRQASQSMDRHTEILPVASEYGSFSNNR
jgi:hypothetical protein